MSNRRLLGERVAVRITGCSSRDGVLISGVKKETKFIQRFHVRFPNGDVRSHRGDQILLRGSRAPLTEFVRVGDIIFTKRTLGVVRFVGQHEEFPDTVIVMESFDPRLPTDPNVKSFRKLFPSANLSDQNSYNILTKSGDILKMLPPDNILQQISKIKDKYLAFVEERKEKNKQYSDELNNADARIVQLENFQAQIKENIRASKSGGNGTGQESREDQNGQRAPRSVSFKFEPGRLGIKAVWATGEVEGVSKDAQADHLGIEQGWKITHVDNEPYSEDVLDAHTAGDVPYTLTFEVPAEPNDHHVAGSGYDNTAPPGLALPPFNEIQQSWEKKENPNVDAGRPVLSADAKVEYEQKVNELSAKIEESQYLVEELQAQNDKLEEDHKEMTKLRVKVQHLRNSRMMFMSQIKQIQTQGKTWKEKALDFERKYQKLLEERGRPKAKNEEDTERKTASPPGTERTLSTRERGNVKQGSNLPKKEKAGGSANRRRKPYRGMPKPEPGNTLSLLGLQASNEGSRGKDKGKKKKKRTSWLRGSS